MSIEKQGPEPYQLPDLTGAYKSVLNTEAVCPGSESFRISSRSNQRQYGIVQVISN